MRSKIPFLTGGFLLLFTSWMPPANSQEKDEMENRLEQLENKQQTLSEKLNKLNPGKNQFRVTGFANFAYHLNAEDFDENRFDHAGFAPIMIWKPSGKLFFE